MNDLDSQVYKTVRRGYNNEDTIFFLGEKLEKLYQTKEDVPYLLNRGYKIKQASLFVSNHYMLQERQRLVLARAIAKDEDIENRKRKISNKDHLAGSEVYIDGFNAIIPMETMLSASLLIRCMDGTLRDLAGLKGNYRIIDKTEKAIRLILCKLDNLEIRRANIYLDKPVSNSGRLKALILNVAEEYNVDINVELLNAVDKALYGKHNVISGDSVVIDESISWIPLYNMILEDYEKSNKTWVIDFYNERAK
ncbi:DUF434 domain-containing protein [Lacrimispora amygdalina]|uniref:DUF434 domain-containing protein n=1 Tax=Lacrimispora amygdalina TaxID=253257 RepID=UPI000BE316DF|nr:DUF434 domain-containing protein [Lacrimispora amygdalina]